MFGQRAKDKKVIELSLVSNESSFHGILDFNEMITNYVRELNLYLPSKYKLDYSIFEISREYDPEGDFLDDGNTPTEGYDYSVLWAYSMFNEEKFTPFYVHHGLIHGFLKFHLDFRERIEDGRIRSRFFESSVCGFPLKRDEDKNDTRVYYINNNYKDGVADHRSMTQTLTLLEEMISTKEHFDRLSGVDFNLFKKDQSFFSR